MSTRAIVWRAGWATFQPDKRRTQQARSAAEWFVVHAAVAFDSGACARLPVLGSPRI